MLCDFAPQYVRDIAPYQPGKPISELERELGIVDIIKLASNENPLGASARALAAAQAALAGVALYPDGNGFALKQALVGKYAVAMEAIVLGNGSNDVLELAARAFLKPGASAVYSQHAFTVYALAVQAAGATAIVTPARDFGHDLAAMRDAIRDDTRMVFIANPNNPTGTFIEGSVLREFLHAVPPQVLVVLDEAYTEYLPREARYHSVGWLGECPNLLITRTFSKAYGLAGLRIGFALGAAPVVDLMNRVRQPFNANSVALAAAEAALDDLAFIEQSWQTNRDGLAQLMQGARELGLGFIPSFGNFLSIKVGAAGEIYQKLLRGGVIVRPIASYGMPEYLRVTVGLPAHNERFLAALHGALPARR